MWNWIKNNKIIATSFLILGWLAHVLLETIVVNTLSALFGLPPLKLA
jgi:hypothetical protein